MCHYYALFVPELTLF